LLSLRLLCACAAFNGLTEASGFPLEIAVFGESLRRSAAETRKNQLFCIATQAASCQGIPPTREKARKIWLFGTLLGEARSRSIKK
jgi:hypothetical protein